MLDEFWSSIAGKLIERWAAMIAPAVVFWAGALLAWAYAGNEWSRLTEISRKLATQDVAAKLMALLGVLLILVLSATVVQRLTLPVLRLLEGYWPRSLRRITMWRRRRVIERKAADEQAWQQIQIELDSGELTSERRVELAELEQRSQRRPIRDHEILPTRVGNILRAAETRPYHRYGLEAVAIWPRLWLVLPEQARQELTGARASLNASVAALIWGTAFVGFTPLAWWAAPAGLVVAGFGVVWWVPNRAEVFADLVEAAYDLYRAELYRQLRWPLPANPADEQHRGQELTRYLVRGSDKPHPEFTPPT